MYDSPLRRVVVFLCAIMIDGYATLRAMIKLLLIVSGRREQPEALYANKCSLLPCVWGCDWGNGRLDLDRVWRWPNAKQDDHD